MSNQVTTAFVQQYKRGIELIAQQLSSRLESAVRVETQEAKKAAYDQVGVVAARRRVSRHADTPRVDTPHKRRWVTLVDYEISDLVDKFDAIRTLNDPQNAYVQTFGAALARAKDYEIAQAALGTSATDETGSTNVTMPSGQQIGAASSGFTLSKLLEASRLLKKATGVDLRQMELHVAWTSFQEKEFLNTTEVKNIDYNAQKVLVDGGVDSFLGFNFHRMEDWTDEGGNTQRIIAYNSGSTTRSCFAWVKDGLLLAKGADITARVDERPDKSYSWQPYAMMSIGATRMQEGKVVQIDCIE
jgi:hypothetical protein